MFESNETEAFAFSGGFVEDYDGFYKFSECGEEGAQVFGCGVPTEAAYEDFALRGVVVGDGSDGVENVQVFEGGALEDVEELVLSQGLHHFAYVVAGQFGFGVALLLQLSLLNGIHEMR